MDAATIAETNRIRVSLGMKPLPVPGADSARADESSDSEGDGEEPGSTIESRQAESYENYNRVREAEEKNRKREEKAAAIRKARDAAQRFAVMEGKGLGEAEDGGDVDAKAWLAGQKKRQKKIDKARKLEEELAAAEAAAAAAVQYTSKDLAGIKVAHDTNDFLDGDEQVLTLKDTTIGENEEDGDELENLGMREHEKLTDRLDLKKKRPGYNPNDDEDGQGGILAQYDEEIEGKKTKKFTLDADGAIAELSDILDQPTQQSRKLQTVSLDDIVGAFTLSHVSGTLGLTSKLAGDATASTDYLDASEIKVKKPKKTKNKNKNTRQKQYDEDDIFPLEAEQKDETAMDVDSKPAASKKRKTDDEAFVDDDDLQASLAIQRKNALKKRKKTRPEDIAKQLRDQEQEDQDQDGPREGGLVIGEISEFVAGLNKPEEEVERKPRRSKPTTMSPDSDEDHPMGDGDESGERERHESLTAAEEEDNGIEEEKTIGEGMGAALALLRERGLVEKSEGGERHETMRQREEFLSRKRMLEDEQEEQTRLQRERDRNSGRLDRIPQKDREEYARQQNTWRDQQQSRRMADLYSAGYKPNVELRYTDEHGRQLDQKEAFKHLSHQFHGKGSGKGKTEKLLKKIDDEKRREAQSMFDASQNGGMSVAAAQQLKKRREAGVRLG